MTRTTAKPTASLTAVRGTTATRRWWGPSRRPSRASELPQKALSHLTGRPYGAPSFCLVPREERPTNQIGLSPALRVRFGAKVYAVGIFMRFARIGESGRPCAWRLAKRLAPGGRNSLVTRICLTGQRKYHRRPPKTGWIKIREML